MLAVPKLRNKVIPVVAQVKEGLQSLRSPSKVAMVIGGNALTQMLYGVTLASRRPRRPAPTSASPTPC